MTYLDHAATTPVRPEVRALQERLGVVGNPASTHRSGQAASALLEAARERLAATIDAHPTEVVFTSGGTESVNLALKGLAWARGGALVVPVAEHHASLDAAEWLEQCGTEVRWVGVDAHARVDEGAWRSAVDGASVATALVANNETGSLERLDVLADAARSAGAALHLDAVGAFGHVPVSFRRSRATAMSIAAHKLGGPVGVGALLVARDAAPEALVHGGRPQRGLRAGTQDVVGAQAFALAAELAVAELEQEARRLRALSDRILDAACAIDGVRASADDDRLPGIAHVVVDGCDGETLAFVLDARGFEVSNGSACTAGVVQQSHVVRAMGVTGRVAPVRISLGWSTTDAEVDALVAALPEAVARARAAA